MALPPETRRPKKKIRRKAKPYTLPKTYKPEATTRKAVAKAGPPSPQRTGRPKTPQAVVRKRNAPPTTMDVYTNAERAKARAASEANIKAARRAVVRKRGRGVIVRQAKAELEGRGVLAKGLGALAERATEAPLVSTGGGPSLGVKAGRKLTGTRAPRGAATALAPKPLKVKGTGGEAIIKDLLNLPAQALPSVYVPVAGAVEAARGRPQRIKQFAKDIKQHDPIYNVAAAGVEAARGRGKQARQHLKKAGKSFEEHPGYALAEAVGAKGAVGRGTGSAARAGALGRGARRAASTERASRRVPGTNVVEKRVYSRDVITKGAQVAVERGKRRSAQRLRQKATTAPHDRAVELREKAARKNPARLSEREIQRRVDERVAVNEDIRRAHRGETVSEARKVVKQAKREGHATSVVAQRIARADRKDLQAYVSELQGQFDGLSNSGKRANKTLRRELQKVIDDPQADLGRVEEAARSYEKLIRPLERKLVKRRLLAGEQEARAKLIPYAVRNMGARHEPAHWVNRAGEKVSMGEILRARKEDPTVAREEYTHVPARLLSKQGNELSTGAIRAHMRRAGVEEPAFITQAPGQRGSRNFNVRSERPVMISGTRRTGEATRKGTFDAHPETLVEGAARARGLVDATDGFRRSIKEFGVRKPSGKLRTHKGPYREAKKLATDLVTDEHGEPIPGAVKLRPVLLNPFGAKKEQLDNLIEEVDSLDQPHAEVLVNAMREGLTATSGNGRWAFIPEAAAKRLEEHLQRVGGPKTLQLANQAFRKTVLATSPTWMTGNVIEGLGRAALAKAGPGSYRHGKASLRELERIDPKMAEEALHRIVGGGHFSSASRLHIRRGAEQFEGTTLAPLATALGKFWRAPGPKHATQVWNWWTEAMFRSVNGRLESKIQTAMLGRALKDSGLKAIEDAAKGLTNTESQVRFGREVDKMYGRYGKLRPNERMIIATYTPFAMWAVNSAYFVYRTLPRDHPVATAVIAASVNATEEWRQSEGLDLFMQGALPGFLQGSIPTGGGAHQRLSRYTPFGAFGDPTETAASQVLPLMSGVIAALKGQDWKGKELKVKGADGKQRAPDPLEKAIFGAKAFLEATVPIYGQGKRIVEQGPRSLDPFRDVKPYEKGPKKKLRVAKSGAGTGRRTVRKKGGFFDSGSSSSGGSSGGFFSK